MSHILGTNTFVSLSDANDFHATQLSAGKWAALTDPTKEAALMTATRVLGTVEFIGHRSTATQTLAWPRTAPFDSNGRQLSPGTVPEVVQWATAELALALAQHAASQAVATGSGPLKKKTVGDLSFEFFAEMRQRDALPAHVRETLASVLLFPSPYNARLVA